MDVPFFPMSFLIYRVPNHVPEDCLYIPDLHRPLLKSISGSLAASGMALICFSFHRRGKGGNWVEWVVYGSISYQIIISFISFREDDDTPKPNCFENRFPFFGDTQIMASRENEEFTPGFGHLKKSWKRNSADGEDSHG